MRGRSTRIATLWACSSLLLAGGASAQNRNHYWSAFVSTRGGLFHSRSNNVPVSATDGMANVSASLAYSRYTRSSIFTLSGWTSGLFLGDFNFGSYSGTASGAKQLSDQASVHFGAGISNGFNYQDLIINGIFFVNQDILSTFANAGGSYDFTPKTTGSLDFNYNRFRFELEQRIDGSEFVFLVPGDEQILIPIIPRDLPFPTDTNENVIDASRLVAGLLAAEGALLREFTTETFLLNGGLSHQLSNRTEVGGQLGYRWLEYERPGTVAGNDLFAILRMSHTFNFKTDASASYTYRRNVVFDPAVSSHGVLGRINRQLSAPIRIDGSFGFTYYALPGENASGYHLIGGAGLSGQYVRTAFNLSYSRRAQHSIGIGRFLTTDLADAGLSYVFSRDWSAVAYTGYRGSRGTFDENFAFQVLLAGADARYRINEEFSVGGSYLFRHLERDVLNYDTHLLSVVLSFGKTWK